MVSFSCCTGVPTEGAGVMRLRTAQDPATKRIQIESGGAREMGLAVVGGKHKSIRTKSDLSLWDRSRVSLMAQTVAHSLLLRVQLQRKLTPYNFSLSLQFLPGKGSYSFSPFRFTVFSLINLGKVGFYHQKYQFVYFREQCGFIGLLVLSLAFVERKQSCVP